MAENFLDKITEYRDMEVKVLQNLDLNSINEVMNVLEDARKNNRHIFICGNGGSAATASHYAGDFNKGVNMGLLSIDAHSSSDDAKDIKDISVAERIAAARAEGEAMYSFECLSDNQPTMLAVANDESYSEVFRYPLSVKMEPGDIVIGISGSGNSANVVNALDYANAHNGTTIAIVGYDGGKMKKLADHCIHVDINDMQVAEDIHMFLDHLMMWVLTH